MAFTLAHIKALKEAGKIKGYSADKPRPKIKYTENGVTKEGVLPRDRPAGLLWLDLNLSVWCKERSLELKQEYRFDAKRRWRFDYGIPDKKIAVEYEGGIFLETSGHTSVTGMNRDIEKYTRAQVLGWTVIRVTASNYKTVLETLNDVLKMVSKR